MPMFKVNIEALTKRALRDKVHIAVAVRGDEEYAKHVGADSYGPCIDGDAHGQAARRRSERTHRRVAGAGSRRSS